MDLLLTFCKPQPKPQAHWQRLVTDAHLLFGWTLLWFDSLRPCQQFFSYIRTGLPGLNQYLARINVSCSRTQRSIPWWDSNSHFPLGHLPGRVAQSVTCLATEASLTADTGVVSSIPSRSHTFVEIDHEIISTVILLPSAESFKKGCCQLQAKVCARSNG